MKTLGKIVTFLGAALLSTSLFAQELPKVKPEQLRWMLFGRHPTGQRCITTGYDTDGDSYEDTKFHYMVYMAPDGTSQVELTEYAVDRNRDKYFTKDEWIPYVRKENNGGRDLHLPEPGNRREVSY